ncbi:MAG: phosphonate C-P lyase system protein PhnH [Lachnospiraceae bacterium]|nr:phosphonate C-P lyase system protein PhnH [Lachnospiraceae bacterium]
MSTLSKKYSFHEVFDSQKLFRLILEAMSNPTRTVDIREYADKMFGDEPALLAVAMTLLDNEIHFNTCENAALADEITSLTLAKGSEPEDADFIFVCKPDQLQNVMECAKCGTLSDPHKSATVVIRDDSSASGNLTLYGPGIDGECQFPASDLVQRALQLRDAQYYEYPQGIDFIFIAGSGELFAIPRLVRWEVR